MPAPGGAGRTSASSPRPPGPAAPGLGRLPAAGAAGSTTTPASRRSASSSRTRCWTRWAVRHRRRALRRLLLPVPEWHGPGADDDATYAAYGAGLHRPGRLAAGQHRHAGPGDGGQDQGGQAVGEVRHQPVRHLAQRQATDPHGSDTTGAQSYDDTSADTRKWVKRGAGSTTSCRSSTGTSAVPAADYAELVPWWARRSRGTRVQLYVGQADYKAATRPTARTG